MNERTREERFRAARRDPALAVLEGFHALKHALRFGAEILEAVAVAPDSLARLAAELAPDVEARLAELTRDRVPADVFAGLAPRPPATGVLAIARRRPTTAARILAASGAAPVVALVESRHAGNLGAAVRVSAAAGAAGVLSIGGRDPWEPEAIRGAAGLQYAIPVARADELPSTDRLLVAIDPRGEPLPAGGAPRGAVLAFGAERHGLGHALLARSDAQIAIPMRAGVSSLNLATAVAVVLYAWRAEA